MTRPPTSLKSQLRAVTVRVLRVLALPFFQPRYLQGRWFASPRGAGWRWVWRSIWLQRVLGLNRHVPWPASPSIGVVGPENIDFDPDDLNNFQTFGCYFQCPAARIRLGHGTYIAPNVGLITSNHDPLDAERHLPGQDIAIGRQCWIGMNAVILPGVELGDHTTVGAGAVVTRSFPEGHCILAGVPAQVIRTFGRPTPADAHQR